MIFGRKLLLVAALTCSGVAIAEHPTWSLGADPELIQQAREAFNSPLPNGNRAVQLAYRMHVHVGTDDVVQAVRIIDYYPSQESVHDSAAGTITWNAFTQDVAVLEAATVVVNGDVVRFDPSTAQPIENDRYNTFSDTSEIVLQYPSVEPGTMTVLSYKRMQPLRSNYFFSDWIAAIGPFLQREFVITWDETPPAWYVDEGAAACEELERRVICRSLSNQPIRLDHKVYYSDVLPTITIAEPGTWDDVIRGMRSLVEAAASDRSALASQLEMLRALSNPIPELHALVGRKIRYVSFSEGYNSHAPHAVADTIANRYGDCKDKSTLLYALLVELGFDAYPVLVATKRSRPDLLRLPSRGYFDHMVVCFELQNGKEQCLDPTDVHSASTDTSRFIQGKVRLDLVPGGRPERMGRDDYLWRLEAASELQFLANGDQRELLRQEFRGHFATQMRDVLASRDPPGQVEWLEERVANVITKPKTASFQLGALDDLEAPLIIDSDVVYAAVATPGDPLDYVDAEYWLRQIVRDNYIHNDSYDAQFDGVRVNVVQTYDVEGLWRIVDTGASVDMISDYGRYYRSYELDPSGERVAVQSFLEMPARVVPVDEFERFNQFLSFVYQQTQLRFWGRTR